VEDARANLARAVQLLDKAVSKGVIHRNAAARRKSRLARQFNALAAR
jgi:small subunit ribosomal protein S20